MTKKILVAGVNGFVGHHVATQLNGLGVEVFGVGNQPELEENLKSVVGSYVSCDLTSASEVAQIDLSSVGAIINLAGFAKVGDSKGRGELYNRVNVGVHTVLYEECLKQGVAPRIVAVSTGAVYDPRQNLPITEDSRLINDASTNEYVISKKLMEEAVVKFNEQGLHCVIARPLNHTGPGQLPGFLLPDLGQQIIESAKEGSPLKVGNLETKRDFTDVRDVAKAYIDLALCEDDSLKHDVYNICSGKSVAGSKILDLLAKAYGITNLQTEADPSLIRENEVMDIYGSHERLTTDTGWAPTIPLSQTVNDFVDWQKSRI